MDFSQRMQPVKRYSQFSLDDEGFMVWCGSVAKGEDGRYYLYFSFWPKEKGFEAWVTHSKIGYAVSEDVLGPYTYQGIILTGAGGNEWDRDCVHNPAVLKVDGIYYLYYMGNYGDGTYWDHRNHQRVGVAWSKRPEGPFRRLDTPLLDVRPGYHDSLVTNNPTACVGPDGKIYLMYKSVSSDGELPKGGAVVCSMAVADHPMGPFTRGDSPIMVNPENPWSVEDPFLWYEGDRFYALVKDFQGYFTHADAFSVALFESFNGFDWAPAQHPLAYTLDITWEDGETEHLQNMERPQMWLDEQGRPRVLCCACTRPSDPKREHPFNIQIGIE